MDIFLANVTYKLTESPSFDNLYLIRFLLRSYCFVSMAKIYFYYIFFLCYAAVQTLSAAPREENFQQPSQAVQLYEKAKNFASHNLYAQALEYYNQSLQAQPDHELFTALQLAISELYLTVKNIALAKEHGQRALRSAVKYEYRPLIANAHAQLGQINEKEGNYLEAIEHQQKSLRLFWELKDTLGLAQTKRNLGSIYEDLNQVQKSFQYFEEAYALVKNCRSTAACDILNNLGDTYRKNNQLPQALHYTQKALQLALELNDSHLLESAYKDLAKTYAALENYKEAYRHRLQAAHYKNRSLQQQNTRQINFLQARYSLAQKKAEISLLKEKTKVNSGRQKLLLLALIAVISYGIIAGYLVKKRRKSDRKLQQYKERTLQAELEQKQIQETLLQQTLETKTASLSTYSLQLSQKNNLLQAIAERLKKLSQRKNTDFSSVLKKLVSEIEFNIKQDTEWEDFSNFFNEIHPSFNQQLNAIASDKLSPAELKLGMLLRLNLSSKEIAAILRVTPDSVRVARYRLRKKLPIDPKEELVSFMLNI